MSGLGQKRTRQEAGSPTADVCRKPGVSSATGDPAMRLRIRELAAQRRRFGHRRLHLLLTREGRQKCFRRRYREEKLRVRKRGGRKRAPIALPGDRSVRPASTWTWQRPTPTASARKPCTRETGSSDMSHPAVGLPVSIGAWPCSCGGGSRQSRCNLGGDGARRGARRQGTQYIDLRSPQHPPSGAT